MCAERELESAAESEGADCADSWDGKGRECCEGVAEFGKEGCCPVVR